MLKKKSILSIAAAGVALMAIAGSVSADTTTTAANASTTTQQTHHGNHKGSFTNQQLLTLLQIDAPTLHQDLKAGQSLADIASAKNVNEQDVINLLVQQSTARIDKAVQTGKLTQDQATQREAKLADQVKKMVEHKGGFAHKQKGKRGRGQLKQVATVLGIDQQQLMTQLKAGQSIADVASAAGIDEATLINKLVDQTTQKINAAVQAGKLTQDKATQIESKLPDRIKKMVERKGFGNKHLAQHSNQTSSTPASSTN